MTVGKALMILQERDFNILKCLFESRVLTSIHVSTLFFDGKREAAKKRLQSLKRAGFIGERRRTVTEPALLFLTPKSFKALKESGNLAQYPANSWDVFRRRSNVSDLTIRHELGVLDVKAAFFRDINSQDGLSLMEFTTWPELNQFEVYAPDTGHQTLVKPDGFIRIHESEANGETFEHTFFLEVDRSTEVQETLIQRALCYAAFYRSGGFAVWNGAAPTDFRDFPYRLLIVCKSAERRNNFAERLLSLNTPIYTQVYLSTFAEVVQSPLMPIWIRPKDLHDAVRGTPFDFEHRRKRRVYLRQVDRDLHIEKNIRRVALLD